MAEHEAMHSAFIMANGTGQTRRNVSGSCSALPRLACSFAFEL